MKVMMSNVPRKTAYEIIEGFYTAFCAMNYPVKAYRKGVLHFIDVDDNFRKTVIRYDDTRSSIIMETE